ncbi:MAG TPA: glycosyltransferase family 4 protein [Gemmatimonadales bacterium]|nr:glycosyltransferase family 4 protein [Gemmatimonadales bacterium]
MLEHLRGLRVAQLIECDGPGGAERVVASLSAGLVAAGCEVVAFLPAGGEGWLARELAPTGASLEYFRLDRPISLGFGQRLAAALRRLRIDIAHSHEFTLACYGAWAARAAGIPHLFTMHGGRYYAGRLTRRVALRTAAALSRPVAVSQTVAAALRRDLWLHAPIATVPNGVRCTHADHSTLRHELRLDPEDRLLLAIGNLYPVKGHALLIEALARLAPEHPLLHVAIAGRGDLAAALAEQARHLGIAHRVHFLRLRDDVPNLLAAADVMVHPSLSEGLPLALLEAMFAGKAIVASATGEIPAALNWGTAGVLVPPGDVPALAAGIDRVLRAPAEATALGQAARARGIVLQRTAHARRVRGTVP